MPNNTKDWWWWFFVSILLAYTINLSTDYMKSYEGVFYFVVVLVLLLFIIDIGYNKYEDSKKQQTEKTKQQIEYYVGVMEYDSNIFTAINTEKQTYLTSRNIAAILYIVLLFLLLVIKTPLIPILFLVVMYVIFCYIFLKNSYKNIEFEALDEYIRRKHQQYKEYKQ